MSQNLLLKSVFRSPVLAALRKSFLLVLCTGLIACGGDPNGGGRPDDGDVDTTTQTETDTGPALVDVSDDVKFESVETEWDNSGAAPNDGSNSDPGQQNETNPGQQNETGQTDPQNETGQTDPQNETGQTDPQNDPPSPERSTLTFNTNPGQATVTLVQEGGDVRKEAETPVTFEVPPGLYSWTVKREGYAQKESQQALNLQTQRSETKTVELRAMKGEKPLLERAQKAQKSKNYQKAINLYRKVPEPDPNQDAGPYLRAQMQLGNLYWKQRRDYENAKRAYRNVIDQDETRYRAFLNLARLHYDIESYREVLKNLDRVKRLKLEIPAKDDRRGKVMLRVRYRRALTHYQLAKSEETSNRRSNALTARTELLGFKSSVPSDLKSEFSEEIENAEKKLKEISDLLKEIN